MCAAIFVLASSRSRAQTMKLFTWISLVKKIGKKNSSNVYLSKLILITSKCFSKKKASVYNDSTNKCNVKGENRENTQSSGAFCSLLKCVFVVLSIFLNFSNFSDFSNC